MWIRIKPLEEFMNEKNIADGEEIDQLPMTNWYVFDDCFGYVFGYFDNKELNQSYILLSDTPKINFEDIKKKYHFENGEVVENE